MQIVCVNKNGCKIFRLKNKLIYNFITNLINFTILQFRFLNIEILFLLLFCLRTKRKKQYLFYYKNSISYRTRNFQAKLQLFNYLLYYSIYYKYELYYFIRFIINLLIYYKYYL